MEEGYNEHGEVFTVPVAHKRVTFLIGPDVSPHFFKASDEEMSQSEVCGLLVLINPATGLSGLLACRCNAWRRHWR